jgi:7-carboxy-7-deazaguanine synthase
MLRVFSIFRSIQGESLYQGFPTGFVRLAGCPLHCRYCDSRVACESSGSEMSIEAVAKKVLSFGLPFSAVTGGEPLYQEETPALLTLLADRSRRVILETSGALDILEVDRRVHVVMDIKCPGSGMSDHIVLENLESLTELSHELKFVLSSMADFDWSLKFLEIHRLFDRELLFSPVWGLVNPADIAEWVLKSRITARVQLQLHKVIWPGAEEER